MPTLNETIDPDENVVRRLLDDNGDVLHEWMSRVETGRDPKADEKAIAGIIAQDAE
jgi:hypothetical protein